MKRFHLTTLIGFIMLTATLLMLNIGKPKVIFLGPTSFNPQSPDGLMVFRVLGPGWPWPSSERLVYGKSEEDVILFLPVYGRFCLNNFLAGISILALYLFLATKFEAAVTTEAAQAIVNPPKEPEAREK